MITDASYVRVHRVENITLAQWSALIGLVGIHSLNGADIQSDDGTILDNLSRPSIYVSLLALISLKVASLHELVDVVLAHRALHACLEPFVDAARAVGSVRTSTRPRSEHDLPQG